MSCIGRCDAAPAVAVNECPAAAQDADALVTAAGTGHRAEPVPRAYGGGAAWPNDPYPVGQRPYDDRGRSRGRLGIHPA